MDVQQIVSEFLASEHGNLATQALGQSSELKPKARASAVFLSHVFVGLGSGFARFC